MIPRGAEHALDDVDDQDHGARGQSAASRSNLQPFKKGDPAARLAGLKGAETRRRQRDQRRRENMAAEEALRELSSTFSRDQLGPMAVAAALHMMGEVVAGRQRVREPALWVKVLVDIARLEAGEVTSATAHVDITADDIARAVSLRDAARRALPQGDVP